MHIFSLHVPFSMPVKAIDIVMGLVNRIQITSLKMDKVVIHDEHCKSKLSISWYKWKKFKCNIIVNALEKVFVKPGDDLLALYYSYLFTYFYINYHFEFENLNFLKRQ